MRPDSGGQSQPIGALGVVARIVHVVILSIWFGASVLFLTVLAPTVFELVPSRHEAGNLITAMLEQVDFFGLLSGPLLLITVLVGWSPLGVPVGMRSLLTVAMTVATAISGRWLTPELLRLRLAMGRRIEDVDPTDPLRTEFARLHGVSTTLMILHTTLALVLLVYAVAPSSPRRRFGIEL